MLDYPLADVIHLLRDHLEHNRRAQKQQKIQARPQQPQTKSGKKVVYRQADDSWF